MSARIYNPDQQSTENNSTMEAGSAVAEPPMMEGDEAGQGFAEKVGKKKWTPAPDPFGLAVDNVAGVRLFESKQDRQMAMKFGNGHIEDKPSQAVIDRLKVAGYRWNPSERIWAHPVRMESAMSTRVEAKRLYLEVCQMIRMEKGVEDAPETYR